MAWTQRKYSRKALRSVQIKSKNDRAVMDSAAIPEYVSIRQRRYGDCHGRRR